MVERRSSLESSRAQGEILNLDQASVLEMGAMAIRNGSESFRSAPLIGYKMIPFAADEEFALPILHQLHCQMKDNHPFGVLLSLNHPSTSDGVHGDAQEAIIRKFQYDYPELPIAYFRGFYDDATIGEIRKDLAGSAIQIEDSFDVHLLDPEDTYLANHDADTEKHAPNNEQKLQEFFINNRGSYSLVTPLVQHGRSDGELPNMDSVVAWYDLRNRFSVYDSFEQHGAMSRRAYKATGFNASDNFGETLSIQNRLVRLGLPGTIGRIGGVATISPRKFYAQMHQGDDPRYNRASTLITNHRKGYDLDDITLDQAHAFITERPMRQAIQAMYNYQVALLEANILGATLNIEGQMKALRRTSGAVKMAITVLGGPKDHAEEVLDGIRDSIMHFGSFSSTGV